jgi:hypothetical protein
VAIANNLYEISGDLSLKMKRISTGKATLAEIELKETYLVRNSMIRNTPIRLNAT